MYTFWVSHSCVRTHRVRLLGHTRYDMNIQPLQQIYLFTIFLTLNSMAFCTCCSYTHKWYDVKRSRKEKKKWYTCKERTKISLKRNETLYLFFDFSVWSEDMTIIVGFFFQHYRRCCNAYESRACGFSISIPGLKNSAKHLKGIFGSISKFSVNNCVFD